GTVTTNDIGGTGANTIDDAIKNVSTAATKAKTTVTEGDNITVTSSTNTDGSTNYQVATKKDVSFNNVNVGGVQIDGSSNKITGLADGNIAAGSKDAVTGN
ncbi:cell surface protein, partial [Acinetobacter defluvii]